MAEVLLCCSFAARSIAPFRKRFRYSVVFASFSRLRFRHPDDLRLSGSMCIIRLSLFREGGQGGGDTGIREAGTGVKGAGDGDKGGGGRG